MVSTISYITYALNGIKVILNGSRLYKTVTQ